MKLTSSQIELLEECGWSEWTSGEKAIWISVDEQVLRVIENGQILCQRICATAEKGAGYVQDSYQTPLGWHAVAAKTGDDAPWGQVFRGGRPTREVWQYGQSTKEDLVLTRILFLEGLEPRKNKGGNVDSRKRNIYIHGTNDEARLGTPSSHGCIRLANDDVIELYGMLPVKTRALITERRRQ